MDTGLLILIGVVIFAIWFFITIVNYIDSSNQLSQQEQERRLFGKTLRPETRVFIYGFIGSHTKNVIVFLVVSVLIILLAKDFFVI